MFKVEKTLAKTVTMNFATLKELHDWAANNRYTKSRNVKITLNDGSVYLDVRSIYDVYSYTLNKFSENNFSWDNI